MFIQRQQLQQPQHTTIMTPSTNTASLGLYKVTIACAGANTVELEWTDTAGTGGVNVIGLGAVLVLREHLSMTLMLL